MKEKGSGPVLGVKANGVAFGVSGAADVLMNKFLILEKFVALDMFVGDFGHVIMIVGEGIGGIIIGGGIKESRGDSIAFGTRCADGLRDVGVTKGMDTGTGPAFRGGGLSLFRGEFEPV